MSTASAVLRPIGECFLYINMVPMSTASAVLRRVNSLSNNFKHGTYVYCFGGIETLTSSSVILSVLGTYVYCFGGIET